MPRRYVVDCSVAVKWVVAEPDRDQAISIFSRYDTNQIELIAPELLVIELSSTLSKLARRKLITAEDAQSRLDAVVQSSPKLYREPQLVSTGFKLSLQFGTSLWDSVYAALAIQEDCPLITADERLLRSRLAETVKIISMADVV